MSAQGRVPFPYARMALLEVAKLLAPLLMLVPALRRGIWITPDDPVSPYGCGNSPTGSDEPMMRGIYARWGTYWGDWWWLGVRNRAFGLAYKLKPEHFKRLRTYETCEVATSEAPRWYGRRRLITVDGHEERTYFFGRAFHVIAGYRLRPVRDEHLRSIPLPEPILVRPINMDARPVLTVRAGGTDD